MKIPQDANGGLIKRLLNRRETFPARLTPGNMGVGIVLATTSFVLFVKPTRIDTVRILASIKVSSNMPRVVKFMVTSKSGDTSGEGADISC